MGKGRHLVQLVHISKTRSSNCGQQLSCLAGDGPWPHHPSCQNFGGWLHPYMHNHGSQWFNQLHHKWVSQAPCTKQMAPKVKHTNLSQDLSAFVVEAMRQQLPLKGSLLCKQPQGYCTVLVALNISAAGFVHYVHNHGSRWFN